MEEEEAESKTEVNNKGELMWVEQWIDEARKLRYGALTRDQALAKWQEWKAALNDPARKNAIYHDMDGPGPSEVQKLRICVMAAKEGNLSGSFARREKMRLSKTHQTPVEEAIAAAARQVQCWP